MKILKNKWLWIVLVIIMIGGFFVYQKSQKTDVIEEVETVRGDLVQSFNVSGTVDRTDRLALAFQAFGTVEKIHVDEGDQVEEGDLLAEIESPTLNAQYYEASLAVQSAEQEEQLARRKWDKYKPEQRKQFTLAVDQARARRSQVASELNKTNLYAPRSGIVTQINATEGEFAKEQSVMFVSDGPFRIEALVSEIDIPHLTQGQEAQVTFDAMPTEVLTATVTNIAQQATIIQDVVYYEVEFDLSDQPEELRIGMSADVDIVVDEKENVLVLPLRVIEEDGEGLYVFVKVGTNGDMERRIITTGLEGDDGRVEIASGLSEGETVVVRELEE